MGRLLRTMRITLKKMDLLLLGLCLVATVYGIVLIASATHATESYRSVIVQGAAMVIGVGMYVAFSLIDIEHFSEKWWLFFLFDVVLILLLKTSMARGKYGNLAWLAIPGLPFMIQPAEVVKLPFTILLAKQTAWFREHWRMRGLGSAFWPAAHTGFMFILIYAVSSDAGSAMVYLVIYLAMAFAAGLCQRFALLKEGRLLGKGDLESLRKGAGLRFRAAFRLKAGEAGPAGFRLGNTGLWEKGIASEEEMPQLIAQAVQGGGSLFEARVIRPTLAEIYEAYADGRPRKAGEQYEQAGEADAPEPQAPAVPGAEGAPAAQNEAQV